jgi:hypothetical protein
MRQGEITFFCRPIRTAALTLISGGMWITSLTLTSHAGAEECLAYELGDLTTQAGVDSANQNCTSLSESLFISGDDITNVDSLSNLTSVSKDVIIQFNEALADLDGLSGLTAVKGYIQIWTNKSLENINGLSELKSVDSLEISVNPVLANLDALQQLSLTLVEGQFRSGYVYVVDNIGLLNVDGLSGLSGTVSQIDIEGNDSLLNVDGLSGITAVTKELNITKNTSLTNLDGLVNVGSVGGGLSVYANPSLANCQAIAPLLGWPDGPPADSVGGAIRFESFDNVALANATGCNSVAQVLGSVVAPGVLWFITRSNAVVDE